MSEIRRGRIFVDSQVQGALTIRVIAYWFYCLLSVTLMLACWTILNDKPRSSGELLQLIWERGAPGILASFLVLPIVMVDCVRMSNRFAGPILRLRRGLRQLADGEPTRPIIFRTGDFLTDIAE